MSLTISRDDRADLQRAAAHPEEFAPRFREEDLAATFYGDFSTGINACVESCDRYAGSNRVALEWESEDGRTASLTFEELKQRSARFANFLTERGVQPGDVVAGLMPRIPDLLTVVLGAWRAGAAYQPVFTAYSAKAIELRLKTGAPKLLVTDSIHRSKLNKIESLPPVAVFPSLISGEVAWAQDYDLEVELARASTRFTPVMRTRDDILLMLTTSGATGLPKGVRAPIRALMGLRLYITEAVDLRPEDTYWNIADPGWAYGLCYGMIAPLLLGQATFLYDGRFTAENAYNLIVKRKISNLAGSPSAYRQFIASGAEAAQKIKGVLRMASSSGEPLSAEAIRWFREVLDVPIYDHYGQTELGMAIANRPGLVHPVKPGSTGRPMSGHRIVILDSDDNELGANHIGELAVDTEHSPMFWFKGYCKQNAPTFHSRYYRTGDLAKFEADGNICFVGRADERLVSAGRRIGAFEVESLLSEHPAVSDVAVVGAPDPQRKTSVKAFVTLRNAHAPSAELAEELRKYVRRGLAVYAAPDEIEFVEDAPRTPVGKLQRYFFQEQENNKKLHGCAPFALRGE